MPKLFLGNFDFEHRLAVPSFSPPERLKRLNAELAAAWLSIAEDGDWIWTPSPIDPSFFVEVKNVGLPRVFPVSDLNTVPRHFECVPWGWSSDVRKLAQSIGGIANAPTIDAVRLANSRATSARLERDWNVGLEGARRIESLSEFHDAARSLKSTSNRWIVKAEFGMSARERILGQGSAGESDDNWVRGRLSKHGAVFFEPWVERISEVGIQMDVPVKGTPRLIGLTPMTVDNRGQYSGSWFAFSKSRFEFDSGPWRDAIDVALRAATELQLLGYFGPLGIDAMLYRDGAGHNRIRPLQDINARWTMGRMSLGFRRIIESGDEGLWQHASRDHSFEEPPFQPSRIISTSPERVADDSCHHTTRIVLRKTD